MNALRVVLVRTEIAGNIGSVARVMGNMGASDLVLVAPGLRRGRRGGAPARGGLRAPGLRLRRRALAQAYDDVDSGVLEVQRVRVALGAVADDGHGPALEEAEIGVVVVEHGRDSS